MNWVGRSIDKYKVEAIIGQGGTAVVYRAYQPQLERWVAIKVLKANQDKGTDFLERFRQEAKAIALLRHPNILTVYDYGEEEKMPYIVMEYVPGGTLQEEMGKRPMAWENAASLILPIGHALAHGHEAGIVHCDVKPGNILLARPDWALLADFGLLQIQALARNQNKEGTLTGTPAYFAPEQVIGEPIDQRADIYSLALVLYQLVTGHLPFSGKSIIELMLARLNHPPYPPTKLNNDIPSKLEPILLKALARETKDRYSSMLEFTADLQSISDLHHAENSGRSQTAAFATALLETDHLGHKSYGAHLIATGTGATLALAQKEELLIGRADPRITPVPDVDLSPHGGDVAGVSRIHARLRHSTEGWFLQDLDSTNGTFVNNIRLTSRQPMRIRSNDTIRFGKMKLLFYDD